MKNLAKAALTAVAATLAVTVPVGSASATNEVKCTSNEFLRIQSTHGAFCFANGGAPVTMYQIDGVSAVSSGNNVVNLRTASGKAIHLNKHQNVRLAGVTINYIDIV